METRFLEKLLVQIPSQILRLSKSVQITLRPWLNLGIQPKLTVGETAPLLVVPLGTKFANSGTQGIVSSLGRTVKLKSEDGQIYKSLQTDAAINLGNSGGPLINIQDKSSELPQVNFFKWANCG